MPRESFIAPLSELGITSQSSPETSKATKTKLVQGATTALVPRGQAGIESVWRSIEGEAQFHDFNEGFFAWVLDSQNLTTTVERHAESEIFRKNLDAAGITQDRLHEVIVMADSAREALGQHETYRDFENLKKIKKVFKDATIIASAPYSEERLLVEHNSVGYWNTEYSESRESLLDTMDKPGLFQDFINAPGGTLDKVLDGNPIAIGLSVTHPGQYVFTFQLAYAIRQRNPNVLLVLGGNMPTRRLDTWVKDDETNHRILRKGAEDPNGIFDAIMIGEGEEPWAKLTSLLKKYPDISTQELFKYIPSIIYNHHEQGIVMRRLALPQDPERFYKPTRNIFDQMQKSFMMPQDEQNHSMVYGRVCTYECATGGCNFCSISKGYQEKVTEQARLLGINQLPLEDDLPSGTAPLKFEPLRSKARGTIIVDQRQLDIDVLGDEIARAYESGFPIIDFVDEQLTASQIIKIGEALEQRGLKGKIRFSAYMRIDDFEPNSSADSPKDNNYDFTDPQTAQKLAEAGLAFAQFGLETTFPPKIVSMLKGTMGGKVDRFKQVLENFAQHNIMPHTFIIVGNPIEANFFHEQGQEGNAPVLDQSRFGTEKQILGRDVTPDDLEILEAIYNLHYLHELREYIFTMKHTQYKLSLASPMGNELLGLMGGNNAAQAENKYGVAVVSGKWKTKDLAPNIPFTYLPGRGPSTDVVTNLLRVYDLWKQEELPYQPVTQELMYHQRLLSDVGAQGVRELARSADESGEERLSNQQQSDKNKRLYRLWVQLVGGQEGVRLVAQARKQPENRKLQEKVQANMFVREFPQGFQNWSDLYRAADLLEQRRITH